MSLQDRIATPDAKRRHVRALFATIADRYDLITVLFRTAGTGAGSGGWSSLPRRVAGARALDLATGTGDIAFALATRAARVIGLDITPRMIELARRKADRPGAPVFLVGDMVALPFPAGSFDLVTTGYGLRNVPDLSDRHRRNAARAQAVGPGALARFQSSGQSAWSARSIWRI